MIRAVCLKTEYLSNPSVIDIAFPKLFWKVQGAVRQTAYQIKGCVDGREVYDTGKVEASDMYHKYGGELVSRNRVAWKVRLWDEADSCGEWSE